MSICHSKFTPNLETAEGVGLDDGDVVIARGMTCLRLLRVINDRCRSADGAAYGYHAYYVELPEIEMFLDEKSICWWEGKPEPRPVAVPLTEGDKLAVRDRAVIGRSTRYR